MKHVLDIDDLTSEALTSIITRGLGYKADPSNVPQTLSGKSVAMLFEKPSARTRMSTEMAVVKLGGHAMFLRGEEIGLGTREITRDVVRTVAGYADLFAARVFRHSDLVEMAGCNAVPILNLLSDVAHPCQALADLLTIQEDRGTLHGLSIAFVGDGNNVATSLALACAMSGMKMTVASPEGYALSEAAVDRVHKLGGQLEQVRNPHEAVANADVIYTDVWTSMGAEAEAAQRLAAFAGYTVDEELMSAAPSHAIVMHCLPAHRGEEISDAVIESTQSRVWKQAENRMWALIPLLEDLIGGAS
ncbi:MAG: ornithine carbamoyltransferase [Acidimicrobiia bacterium]